MCLAIPARIVELFPEQESRALVEVAGVRRQIDTGLLSEDRPKLGDWVLVHVGFAMTKISEEQALDQIRTLALLGEDEAALQEVKGYSVEEPERRKGS
ncbi:MAG TPA: HypC/HybG/HupF family hydrogenase formation chaperone [Bryobacteraceae bacterium]|nr:HypC/HybG/HupF family hydrogenase formation chaperone [Bryobacteraceae bacterium]